MPRWLHKTSKKLLHSVPSAELPEPQANYIEEPDLSTVRGWPVKYWAISGDVVSLMPPAERATVDDQDTSARRDAVSNQLDQVDGVMRAFALVVLDEINALRAQQALAPRTIAQLKAAVRGKLGS